MSDPEKTSDPVPRKLVRAIAIAGVTRLDDGTARLISNEPGVNDFNVSGDFFRKHDPQPGGFYREYSDGTSDYSNTGRFDEETLGQPTSALDAPVHEEERDPSNPEVTPPIHNPYREV